MASQIQKFYDNQHIFLTGGTGFLGKLLIEKLLRCTNCKRISLLVREKKGKSIQERLDQLFEDPLFERLKIERPDYKERIQSISGDCTLENLGLNHDDEMILIETVNIVFHVAATVRFNEDLKQAYYINVRATVDVINLCKKMKQLKSIVHVSTAFTHCYRTKIDECFYDVPTNYKNLGNLIKTLSDDALKQLTNQIIDKWPNTYTFTKALAEDYINNETKQNHQLPICIFRPGIIVSTYKEPISGWADNLYGLNCAILLTLTGLIRIFHIDGRLNADILPADYCINAIIAIGWEIAMLKKNVSKSLESSPPIYNYVSSIDNPITWQEISYLGTLNSLKYPTMKAYGVPYTRTTNDKNFYEFLKITQHIIPGMFLDFIIRCISGQNIKIMKTYQSLHQYIDLIADIPFDNDQFISNQNVKQLLNKLQSDDRQLFQFDITNVSWLKYFRSYVIGTRQYLLKDPIETLDKAKNRLWWLKNIELLSKLMLNLFIFFIIYLLFIKIFY